MKKQKLYIFVHVPRTAGTTFVRQIETNYKKDQLLRLYRDDLELKSSKSYQYKDYLRLVGRKINKLNKKERNRIDVIYGHRVPYGVHEYFDKEPYYITFVRNPLDRVKSLYNLWRNSYLCSTDQEKKSDKFKYGLLVDGQIPSLINWLENKINLDKMDNIGITQVSFFEKLGYLDNKKDIVGKFIKKFDHVGLTEDYLKSYIYLSRKLRFEKYSKSENISRKIYVDGLGKNEIHKVNSILEKDIKLYKIIRKAIEGRKLISTSDKIMFIGKVIRNYWLKPKLLAREIFVNLSNI